VKALPEVGGGKNFHSGGSVPEIGVAVCVFGCVKMG